MPMDFPDYESLKQNAKMHKFRDPLEDEPEDAFRFALANHVEAVDFVEAQEIRNKVGWDKWTAKQNETFVVEQIIKAT